MIASGDIEAAKVGRATVIMVESIRSFLMTIGKHRALMAPRRPPDQQSVLVKSAHRVPEASRRKRAETGAVFRRRRY